MLVHQTHGRCYSALLPEARVTDGDHNESNYQHTHRTCQIIALMYLLAASSLRGQELRFNGRLGITAVIVTIFGPAGPLNELGIYQQLPQNARFFALRSV